MAIESSGHSRGNPRIYELIENAPKTGKSPTIWAWPEIVDWLRIAGQPVPGPWPPHQQPRPEPEEESLPQAVAESPRAERPRAESPRAESPRAESPRAESPRAERPQPAPGKAPRPGVGLMDE